MTVRLALLLLAALISAGLLYLVIRTPMPQTPDVPPLTLSTAPSVQDSNAGRSEKPLPEQTQPLPPPWQDERLQKEMQRLRDQGVGRQENRDEMLELRQLLQEQLAAGDQLDPAVVERSISRLIEINGSPVMAGVDLSKVRQNVQVAAEIKQIADQMQSAEHSPEQLQQLTKRLESLQGRLSQNVLVQEPSGEH